MAGREARDSEEEEEGREGRGWGVSQSGLWGAANKRPTRRGRASFRTKGQEVRGLLRLGLLYSKMPVT